MTTRMCFGIAALSLLATAGAAQSISTYAGGGAYVNVPAAQVALAAPSSVLVDGSGKTYFTAQFGVYVYDAASSSVSRIAGVGASGYGGDGGPAVNATLGITQSVSEDASGNLLVADPVNNRIRTISGGQIATLAGTGVSGFSGDGGPAASAQLRAPNAVIYDGPLGVVFIADTGNHVIRKIDATGTIQTIAGSPGAAGYSGDGGPASASQLNSPSGLAVDGSGNLYIADTYNLAIRRIDAQTGQITTVAGNGTAGYAGDNGPATAANLSYPMGVTVDSGGNLYIADTGNLVVRHVSGANGVISTFAGNGATGFNGDGAVAVATSLYAPSGVTIDASGNVYVTESFNDRIRVIASGSSIVSTLAGNGTIGYSGDGGPGAAAAMGRPTFMATDVAGNLYIADLYDYVVRKVTAGALVVSTVAGTGAYGTYTASGPATSVEIVPRGIAFDAAGDLYVADSSSYTIRRIVNGILSTFAGTPNTPGSTGDNGPASLATFDAVAGLATAVDPVTQQTNVYVVDQGADVVRKIDGNGIITTVAGMAGSNGYSGDGGLATAAMLSSPSGIAVDALGNIYIADEVNNVVRSVDATTGIIATVAGDGTGVAGYGGDGGSATAPGVLLNGPTDVRLDPAGNLFIADTYNQRVREVSNGIISTVAGNGTFGFSGDGGAATAAMLDGPSGLAFDASGTMYIADAANFRVRAVSGAGIAADTTPPVIVPTVSGPLGNAGWYVGNVTVTWSVTDAQSAIVTQTGCTSTLVSADTAGSTFTCQATSAGGTASQSVTVKRDATPPIAAAAATSLPNTNGWYKNPVTVHFSGSDSTSGIANCTANTIVASEGSGQTSATGTCTDNAGNVSAAVAATGINIDLSAPVVTGSATPSPNSNGWNNTPVTVSFVATDTVSGVGACQAPVIVSTQGANQSVTGQCTDKAGNVGSATINGISVDTIPPTAVATPTPGPNTNGWNNTGVTVAFSGTDSLSGSGVSTCTPNINLGTQGAGLAASGTCVDRAGNSSASVTDLVNIDTAPPSVSVTTPANGASYAQGAVVNASYACVDGLSGIATCSGTVSSGAPINTSIVGANTFSVSASDKAGNATAAVANYTVTAATAGPTIVPVVSGTLGANGWYTSNVTVSFTVTPVAGTSKSGCGTRTITFNTTGVTFTCSASNAGVTKTESVTIRRDAAGPRITTTISPRANAAGWRHAATTVTFNCTDAYSGVTFCPSPVTLSNEGAGQSVSGTAENNAGLSSSVTAGNIDIDLTPPSVAIVEPANGAVFPRNSVVTASYRCTDALSGVAACGGTVSNGSPIDTSRRVTNASFTVNGRDVAGSVTRLTYQYSVQ